MSRGRPNALAFDARRMRRPILAIDSAFWGYIMGLAVVRYGTALVLLVYRFARSRTESARELTVHLNVSSHFVKATRTNEGPVFKPRI